MNKKQIRNSFRNEVFKRDKYKCVICKKSGKCRQTGEFQNEPVCFLDAHHITNRDDMPNGGYHKSNGITLCDDCHIEAERFLSNQSTNVKFSPETLYKKIGSSYKLSYKSSGGK